MARPIENLTPKARKTRADILFAARNIIGRNGIEGVNVMTVCEVAHVGRTSFYNYFTDTDELISAVAIEAANRIKAHFDTLHQDEPRGMSRLRACLEMILHIGTEDPETALLLTSLTRGDRAIRHLLHAEIRAELASEGALQRADLKTTADFLSLSVLAVLREIAEGGLQKGQVNRLVELMLTACTPASDQ